MQFDFEIDGETISVRRNPSKSPQIMTPDGAVVDADIRPIGSHAYLVSVGGTIYEIYISEADGVFTLECQGRRHRVRRLELSRRRSDADGDEAHGSSEVRAPMPGKIVKVLVSEGLLVEPGQALLVIEAMKMQNELRAPRKGCVRGLAVAEGQAVSTGALLLTLS